MDSVEEGTKREEEEEALIRFSNIRWQFWRRQGRRGPRRRLPPRPNQSKLNQSITNPAAMNPPMESVRPVRPRHVNSIRSQSS